MTSRTSPTISGSSALVGSSKSITSGSMHSAPDDGHTLLLPAGELLRIVVGLVLEADSGQQFHGLGFRLLLERLSTRMGASVMLCRMVICGNRLKCWNTMPIFCRWRSISIFGSVISSSSKYILPSVGSSKEVQRAQERTLAAAGGSWDDHDLAAADLGADAVKRFDLAAVIVFLQSSTRL